MRTQSFLGVRVQTCRLSGGRLPAWVRGSVRRAAVTTAFAASVLVAGCGGDAGLELAAADALLSGADQMEATVAEYHGEVWRFDDWRESAVVSSFIARVQADVGDASALESHVGDFEAALGKIRADRETEWVRWAAGMDNVGVLREVANGLQKLAIESLALKDEVRRYLKGWIEARGQASEKVGK